MVSPDEIADVINKVNVCLVDADSGRNDLEKKRQHVIALKYSCDLLTRLVDSDIEIAYDRKVDAGNQEAFLFASKSRAVDVIAVDRQRFERFWELETRLLRESGFNGASLEQLSENIWELVQGMMERPTIPGSVLKGEMMRLQIQVCNRSRKLAKELRFKAKRNAYVFSLLGLGIITTNLVTPIALIDGGSSCNIGATIFATSTTILLLPQ